MNDETEPQVRRLPRGGILFLLAAIVFAAVFALVLRTAKLPPSPETADPARIEPIVAARPAAAPLSPAALRAMATDPAALAAGREVFRTTCAACHGLAGEGIIGPNLTDRHSIHGNDPETILRGIREGYVARGMPAWDPLLGTDKAARAAAFVLTLEGTNVPGKPPQGEIIN